MHPIPSAQAIHSHMKELKLYRLWTSQKLLEIAKVEVMPRGSHPVLQKVDFKLEWQPSVRGLSALDKAAKAQIRRAFQTKKAFKLLEKLEQIGRWCDPGWPAEVTLDKLPKSARAIQYKVVWKPTRGKFSHFSMNLQKEIAENLRSEGWQFQDLGKICQRQEGHGTSMEANSPTHYIPPPPPPEQTHTGSTIDDYGRMVKTLEKGNKERLQTTRASHSHGGA